jgi:protein-L-isoaspartate(D-aspartate) O-methyltransferase
VAAHPVLFSVAFRRKMAELSESDRREWLASLASRVRLAPLRVDAIVTQELREVARGCRLALVGAVERQHGPLDPRHLAALLEVPREQFVRPEDIERSAEDVPLPLDDEGLATISAPHAYCLSFRLLGLAPGDSLLELGAGSGYGAALAAFIVGREGRVITFEIDPRLAAWAKGNLRGERNVEVIEGDATAEAHVRTWAGARKVSVAFAVEALPASWVQALPDGGRLVAPIGPPMRDQRLVLVTKSDGTVTRTDHGPVRYVSNRGGR